MVRNNHKRYRPGNLTTLLVTASAGLPGFSQCICFCLYSVGGILEGAGQAIMQHLVSKLIWSEILSPENIWSFVHSDCYGCNAVLAWDDVAEDPISPTVHGSGQLFL